MITRLAFFALIILCLAVPAIRADTNAPAAGVERFYIGTYSGAIRQSTLNLGTASLGTNAAAASFGDPSFLALTPDRKFLYALNDGAGMVGAFSVSSTNGVLKLLTGPEVNGFVSIATF